MTILENWLKEEGDQESQYGVVAFDFSQEEELNLSQFFKQFYLDLKRVPVRNVRLIIFHVSGFSDAEQLKFFKEDGHQSFIHGYQLLNLILSISIPVISFVKGDICGPLLEPILFSDFLIAVKGTRLSSLFIEKGYLPRMGMLSRLQEIWGQKNIMEFLLNGLTITPDTRRIFPLLYDVVENDQQGLKDLMISLLKKSPQPLKIIKELSCHREILSPAKAHLLERYNFALCFSDPQCKEKIESFFKERSS